VEAPTCPGRPRGQVFYIGNSPEGLGGTLGSSVKGRGRDNTTLELLEKRSRCCSYDPSQLQIVKYKLREERKESLERKTPYPALLAKRKERRDLLLQGLGSRELKKGASVWEANLWENRICSIPKKKKKKRKI